MNKLDRKLGLTLGHNSFDKFGGPIKRKIRFTNWVEELSAKIGLKKN